MIENPLDPMNVISKGMTLTALGLFLCNLATFSPKLEILATQTRKPKIQDTEQQTLTQLMVPTIVSDQILGWTVC